MADTLVLIPDKATKPVRLTPTPYGEEKELEDLIASYPELLAGEQIDPEEPRRWLLVSHQMGIPDQEAGAARWAVDLFFLDQDGTPTFVEVKRQTDTRLRREVVGQVLDYAANAAFWNGGHIQQQFIDTCREKEKEAAAVLAEFLPDGVEADSFWLQAEQKLRDGDTRLIFLADIVPRELQRIVEFLNSQMTKAEVLAVEVRRFSGEGFSTHVPRVLGQTTDAQAAKSASRAGSKRKWDEGTFFDALSAQPQAVTDAVHRLYKALSPPALKSRWGSGTSSGSLNIIAPAANPRSVVSAITTGVLMLNFGWLDAETSGRLADFVRTVLNVDLPADAAQSWIRVEPEAWTPHVDDVIGFLKSLAKAP